MTGYRELMRGRWTLCCFMLGTLWTQRISWSPNHQMTRLNLLQTHQRGSLSLKKWATQMDGVASPTALYFRMNHKESNTSFIVSYISPRYLRQMKTTMQFVHIEGGFFSTNKGRRGKKIMVEEWRFMKSILLCELMCKRINVLESGKGALMRRYWISKEWKNVLSDRVTFFKSYSVTSVWNTPLRNLVGQTASILFWGI